jgi:hypothetical protein
MTAERRNWSLISLIQGDHNENPFDEPFQSGLTPTPGGSHRSVSAIINQLFERTKKKTHGEMKRGMIYNKRKNKRGGDERGEEGEIFLWCEEANLSREGRKEE